MSRSRRRTPIRGITSAESEKSDKQTSHRKLRRAVRQRALEIDTLLPLERELTDPWSMAKDGKKPFNPARHPKLMRK